MKRSCQPHERANHGEALSRVLQAIGLTMTD